jgi:hypothetical protein
MAAWLVAFLFILTSLLALLLFNLERKAFTPGTYQQAFATDEFYERLPGVLAGSLSDSVQSDRLPVSMRGLTPQIWEAFLRDLLPPQTIRDMGDQALASLFSYLNRESDSARLSLQPLKDRMLGEVGMQAVFNLMRSQPPCTFEEMARIAMSAFSQGEISLCNPPEDLYPLVTPLIQGQLQLASAAIPAELTLADVDSLPAGQADPRERLQLARLVMRISPIVPLFLLILLTAVAVREKWSWLRWWGFPLLITGMLALLTGILGAPLSGLLLRGLFAARLPAFLPPALVGDGSRLAAAVVDQLLRPVLFQGLLLALVGGLMLALSLLIHRLTLSPA